MLRAVPVSQWHERAEEGHPKAYRTRQLAANPKLTITGMYNVLEKLRAGEVLTPKERQIHEDGLVAILKQLHDELDAAVFDASLE